MLKNVYVQGSNFNTKLYYTIYYNSIISTYNNDNTRRARNKIDD